MTKVDRALIGMNYSIGDPFWCRLTAGILDAAPMVMRDPIYTNVEEVVQRVMTAVVDLVEDHIWR